MQNLISKYTRPPPPPKPTQTNALILNIIYFINPFKIMKFEKLCKIIAELHKLNYSNSMKILERPNTSNTSQSNFISLVIKTPSHAASTSSVVGIISVVRSPEVGKGTKLASSTTATLSTITIWIPFVAQLDILRPRTMLRWQFKLPGHSTAATAVIGVVPVDRRVFTHRGTEYLFRATATLTAVTIRVPSVAYFHVLEPLWAVR